MFSRWRASCMALEMKSILVLCIAFLGAGSAFARPLIVESPKLLPFSTNGAAFEGDELITTESQEVDPNAAEVEIIVSANFYKRSASGQWVFQSQLAAETIPEFTGTFWPVAMS